MVDKQKTKTERNDGEWRSPNLNFDKESPKKDDNFQIIPTNLIKNCHKKLRQQKHKMTPKTISNSKKNQSKFEKNNLRRNSENLNDLIPWDQQHAMLQFDECTRPTHHDLIPVVLKTKIRIILFIFCVINFSEQIKNKLNFIKQWKTEIW